MGDQPDDRGKTAAPATFGRNRQLGSAVGTLSAELRRIPPRIGDAQAVRRDQASTRQAMALQRNERVGFPRASMRMGRFIEPAPTRISHQARFLHCAHLYPLPHGTPAPRKMLWHRRCAESPKLELPRAQSLGLVEQAQSDAAPLPTGPHIKVIQVFPINEQVANNLAFAASHPPRRGPAATIRANQPAFRHQCAAGADRASHCAARPDGCRQFPAHLLVLLPRFRRAWLRPVPGQERNITDLQAVQNLLRLIRLRANSHFMVAENQGRVRDWAQGVLRAPGVETRRPTHAQDWQGAYPAS